MACSSCLRCSKPAMRASCAAPACASSACAACPARRRLARAHVRAQADAEHGRAGGEPRTQLSRLQVLAARVARGGSAAPGPPCLQAHHRPVMQCVCACQEGLVLLPMHTRQQPPTCLVVAILRTMTPWLSTTDVKEPRKTPRSRSLNRSRTVACGGHHGHSRQWAVMALVGASCACPACASGGSPIWLQCTVISVAGKLSSDATCLLKRMTALAPPCSGAAQTCSGVRDQGAPWVTTSLRCEGCRADLLGPLLPHPVARHPERVLVDGDDLARLEQQQRLAAQRPARAWRARSHLRCSPCVIATAACYGCAAPQVATDDQGALYECPERKVRALLGVAQLLANRLAHLQWKRGLRLAS